MSHSILECLLAQRPVPKRRRGRGGPITIRLEDFQSMIESGRAPRATLLESVRRLPELLIRRGVANRQRRPARLCVQDGPLPVFGGPQSPIVISDSDDEAPACTSVSVCPTSSGPQTTVPVCSICLEEVGSRSSRQVEALRCMHVFHSECIDPWLKDHSTCPECRSYISTH
jgi:hypothetical protein